MHRVDPTIVQAIKALPARHRHFLLEQHARQIPRSRNVEQKVYALAQLIGPREISRYDHLYLAGNGSVFAWYLSEGTNVSVNRIYNDLTREYPGILTGLEPEMEPEKDPQLHRLIQYHGYVALEFGARDMRRLLKINWRERPEYMDHVYRVIIRNNPFTIELRAASRPKQEALLRSLSAVLSIDLTGAEKITITTARQYDALQQSLDARFCGVVFSVNGRGLSRTELDADDISHLETLQDYIDQQGLVDQDEHSRTYEFFTRHPDGYVERAYYTINLDNGNLSLNSNISERAIENLRQNVVAAR